MTSVLVRVVTPVNGVRMVSDWTMANATADEFESGVLTITSTVDEVVVKTFASDQWQSAHVFSPSAYEQFSFRNDPAWQSHVASRRSA